MTRALTPWRIATALGGLLVLILAGRAAIHWVAAREITHSVAEAQAALDLFQQRLQENAYDPRRAAVPDILGGPEHPPLRYDLTRGIAWSHGPDLMNDNGEIQYDPTNGLISQGDLVRKIQYDGGGS